MASITIYDVEEPLKARLETRAARNGWSMEEEAKRILQGALAADASEETLAAAVRRWVDPIGGIDLPEVSRKSTREPPRFE